MRNQVIFLMIVIGCFNVVVGISLAASSLRLIPIANASSNWIATDGQITHSQVYTRVLGEYETEVFCGPEVRYTYRVQGQLYTGDRISFDLSESCSGTEEEQYDPRYTVGSQVVVYYDPEQPNSAVLEPGPYVECYFQVIVGFVFALGGFFLSKKGFKRLSNKNVEHPANDPYKSISSHRRLVSCPYCGREVYDALHKR